MLALGLDPSFSAFGYAVIDTNKTGLERRVISGHEETLPSTVPVTRYIHYRNMVKKLLNTFSPDVVGIESPAFDAGPFLVIHHSLMMFSMEAIFETRTDCVLFDPATLKSLVRSSPTRKGPITKLEMQKFVQMDTLDSATIDNNEADAYCLAYFSTRFRSLMEGNLDPENLSDTEKRVFLDKTKKIKTLKGTKVKRIGHIFRENNRFFKFSKIPDGSMELPSKDQISDAVITYIGGGFK